MATHVFGYAAGTKGNRLTIPAGTGEEELKKRTLTNLYNERPTGLANLHAALGSAVWEAYGWQGDGVGASDEQILERLLALNLLRAS